MQTLTPATTTETGLSLDLGSKDMMILMRSCLRQKRPLLIWGPPGCGKSALPKSLSIELGRKLFTLHGCLLDAVDLRGIPDKGILENGHPVTKWLEPGFLPRESDGPSILNIDDITRSRIDVLNAFLNLVWSGVLGDYQLPNDCWIVASSNDITSRGVTVPPDALCGRFTHAYMTPKALDWCRWAWTAESSVTGREIHKMLISFIRSHPDALYAPIAKGEHAAPSPRTYEGLSDLLHDIDDHGVPDNVSFVEILGTIGKAAGVQVQAHRKLWRELPNIDNVFANPDKAKVPDEARIDAIYAVCCAVSRYMTVDNIGNAITYLNRLPEEFATMAITDATARNEALCDTPEYTQFKIEHPHFE